MFIQLRHTRDTLQLHLTRKFSVALIVAVIGCGTETTLQPESEAVNQTVAVDSGPSQLLDLDGQLVDPFEKTGVKATVFLFVRIDCPISNRYAPEVKRLIEVFSSQDVDFWLVYCEKEETADAVRQHLDEYGHPHCALRDPSHWLVRKAEATITPEAVVFLPDGKIVYRGRIDNLYVDFGKRRAQASEHDLRNALEAVLGGRPVPRARTEAVGCYISD